MIGDTSGSAIAAKRLFSGFLRGAPDLLFMATQAQRIRFAIAVFYDHARLMNALSGFLGLGLGADDIWLAGKEPLMGHGSELHHALTNRNDGASRLLDDVYTLDALPSKTTFCATTGPALKAFQHTSDEQRDRLSRDVFLTGDIGAALKEHAEKDAIIAVAVTSTPELQDECVRILLRTSLHKVYSQECRWS